MARKWKQGYIKVTKKEHGYFQDKEIIPYRSSLELKAIKILTQLYKAGRIKSWKYEKDVFEYIFSLDNKKHRYFMDFSVELNDGTIVYIEVKSEGETKPPKKPKKGVTPAYQEAIKTWVKNQDKWRTVRDYCLNESKKGKKKKFVIWTENELGMKTTKRTYQSIKNTGRVWT